MVNKKDIGDYNIDYSLSKYIPIGDLQSKQILPIYTEQLYTLVAAINEDERTYLESIFKTPIKFILYSPKELLYAMDKILSKQRIYDLIDSSLKAKDDDAKSYTQELIEEIIELSIEKHASDIHLETKYDGLQIRIRIDGKLEKLFKFDSKIYPLISSVIKIFSSLDISQKWLPQDGRFSKTIDDMEYDFRVAILPIITGESIVIRILDNTTTQQNINTLGLSTYNLNMIQNSIHSNSGLILVTGPTGSGKTTTLYSILKELNHSSKKIITIEDPVEYQMENIQQVNINDEIGLTFNDVLKNILRQDPDILMIGEIRDEYSLKIAMQAALTGHLVLATIHTNSAISTIDRLIDLNSPPYLVASTVKTIISQRLIRKLCDRCKEKVQIKGEIFYKACGCVHCNLTGYKGREIISEVLNIDNTIATLIRNEKYDEVVKYTKDKDFISIYENGINKAKLGTTSLEEIYSIT